MGNNNQQAAKPASNPQAKSPQKPKASGGEQKVMGTGNIATYYNTNWRDALGKGHYGTVYKARNKRTGRVVAVKKIEIARTRKSSLKAEVMVLRDVGHHDNIVGLLDVFITGTHVLLVLEMATGGELFDRLVNDGPYSEKKASFHVGSIAGALAFLHAKGIVHRDLKPENLLLSDKGPDAVLKIADFGLSKILGSDQIEMGTVCGTWAYCAPEVRTTIVGHRAHYTAAVDMWSLGVIMYVMMVAYHPFDPSGRASEAILWRNIVSGQFNFKDKSWDNVSEGPKDLIRKLLVKDAAKRLAPGQVAAHPWIAGGIDEASDVSDKPIREDITKDLQQFYKRKFKGAVDAVIAANRVRNSIGGAGQDGGAAAAAVAEAAAK